MNKEIEEQIKNDYRNGDFHCSACLRELEPGEKIHQFGGGICDECFEDVGRGLKELNQSN